MLSKTRKSSPTRIAAGLAGVSALSLVALGLTASGTQAAERITTTVERTIGVDLSSPVPAATPTPTPPLPPEAPDWPETPETPETPVVPEAPEPGTRTHSVERTVVIRDGRRSERVRVLAAPDMPVPPEVPEVTEGRCGPGDETVVLQPRGGRQQRMVICVDRIERIAANAEQHARMGMRHALAGLRSARSRIQGQNDLSAEQKASALAGIDQAIAEVLSQSAD